MCIKWMRGPNHNITVPLAPKINNLAYHITHNSERYQWSKGALI